MGHLNRMLADLSDLKVDGDYWDVRVEDTFETSIDIIDGETVTATSSPSLGAFIRLRNKGFWLYESTIKLDGIADILKKLSLQKVPRATQFKYGAKKQKPFLSVTSEPTKFSGVPLKDKLVLTEKYSSILVGNKKVSSTKIRYRDIYKIKSFFNSVGSQYEYDFNQAGMNIWYTLKEGSSLFEDGFRIYGSKFSEMQNRESDLSRAVEESEKFLSAPAIDPGKYNVLLDPEVAGVFTHESFGHKSEADFMLGDPQALKDWKLGSVIASDCINIVDFGGHINTSGYCPIDDDGVPAQKNYLIKNGVLTGRLHSTETSAQLNEKPTGNSRAMNFEWEPLVRMTSTYIEPGAESLQSILSRSEGAILVEGVKHGSGLSTFTIAPNRGYLIGSSGQKKPVRLTVISGSVFETLKNIVAVSSDFQLHSSAVGGCGKMDQWPLSVADGGPYVLVKGMQVS